MLWDASVGSQREESRQCSGVKGKPEQPARRCQAVRGGAKSLQVKDMTISCGENGRCRSQRYRDQDNDGSPRRWKARERQFWPEPKSVVVIDSIREIIGVATKETRLYISSIDLSVSVVGQFYAVTGQSKPACIGPWK